MLKSALSTSLATELDDPTDTAIIALLEGFIDDEIGSLTSVFKWPPLNITSEIVLLSGASTIEVDGIIDIRKVQRKDNHIPIEYMGVDQIIGKGNDLDGIGPPNVYFIQSFNQTNQSYVLQFDQVADQNYDILVVGLKEINDLASGDHIPFPRNFISIIKHGVRASFYRHEQQESVAQTHQNLRDRDLALYIKNYGKFSDEQIKSPTNSDLSFTSGFNTESSLVDRIIS